MREGRESVAAVGMPTLDRMWKDYSLSYIKNNRASGISVVIAAFISAVLLSLLCSLFYNVWIYEIDRIKVEEGDWQGRITGEIERSDLDIIQNYANVEKAVINEELSGEKEIVVDVTFKNMRHIFSDMPRLMEMSGLPSKAAAYHYSLLNMYLIRSPEDAALRWVFPFSLMVVAIACLSLILVIHNAFAVTMNARIHQFGIFSSIGATPGQIRRCLLQEALGLCMIPVVVGNLFGILISMGIVEGVNILLADVERRVAIPFGYHPLILLFSLCATVLTVWISAWIPAGKMSKMTPLQAIRSSGELQLKKKKNSCVLSFVFGIEGEIAGNALKAQRKAMRTATLSLICSFLAFSSMMCFFAVVIVSQQETYFEKYQDAWDVMVTVRNTEIDSLREIDVCQSISGVESGVVYQKAVAKRLVTQEEISGEMQEIGGFENAPYEYVSAINGGWLVNAPLVIMDDASFLEYCRQIGAEPRLDGAVILNKTRDMTDPDFRRRRVLPYLTGKAPTTSLRNASGENQEAEVRVIEYTGEAPVLREEYGTLDFFELVHFIPVSCWKEIKGRIGGIEDDVIIRILAKDRGALARLNEIEEEIFSLLGQTYEIETENRIQDKINNDNMMGGMQAILSLFCALLAMIGIGNVFSNTFGFVRQRRREFARYLSVGLAPGQIKKIFCIEALVIAGRPVLVTLPVIAMMVMSFIKMSYLEPALFIREIPLMMIGIFILAIFGFVGLAYFLGAKKVLGSHLIDCLRDDTVM